MRELIDLLTNQISRAIVCLFCIWLISCLVHPYFGITLERPVVLSFQNFKCGNGIRRVSGE